MRLRTLEITRFRNYYQQRFEPCTALNVIIGDNAQGKTNIIEAIYLACTGRSFRAKRDSEMIMWDEGYSQIRALFETAGQELEVWIHLSEGQKKIQVNGSQSKGFPFGWPGVVLFTPDDLNIIKGYPQIRRGFLDTEIGALNNQYSYTLNRYQRVLQQRNNLLKEAREGRKDAASLATWNKQFSLYGSRIISIRLILLKKLNQTVTRIYRQLTEGNEETGFRYSSSIKIKKGMEEQEIAALFGCFIKENEREEIQRGQSIIGPHRDDIIFLINEKEARTYGSQGQQRSLILALKLALLKMWYNETREYPILLLDDVLSELDNQRQRELMRIISSDTQTFISSSNFSDINTDVVMEKSNFQVKKGEIIS